MIGSIQITILHAGYIFGSVHFILKFNLAIQFQNMKKLLLFFFFAGSFFTACSPPIYYLEYRINNLTTEEVMVIATPIQFLSELDTFFVSPNSCSTIFIDEISRNAKDGFVNAGLDSIMATTFEIYQNEVRFNRDEKPIENWQIEDEKGRSYFTIDVKETDF